MVKGWWEAWGVDPCGRPVITGMVRDTRVPERRRAHCMLATPGKFDKLAKDYDLSPIWSPWFRTPSKGLGALGHFIFTGWTDRSRQATHLG